MKRRFVQIDGVLYERGTEPQVDAPMVMDDIAPYRSMIDGSMITSRSKHREHLRTHDCQELGNEPIKYAAKPYGGIPDVNPQRRKELIRSQIDALSHRQFKEAIRKDVQRIKWNSRDN